MLPDLAGMVESFDALKSSRLNFLESLEWIELTLNWSCSRISSTVGALALSSLSVEHGPCLCTTVKDALLSEPVF